MTTPVFRGCVSDDGALLLDARGLFKTWLAKHAGKRVILRLEEQKPPKSHDQLGYLFGVLYPFMAREICGYTDYESTRNEVLDALHDACMRQLHRLRPDPNPLQLRESLREWDMGQVSRYIEDLRTWAVIEHGCVTPDAEPTTTGAANSHRRAESA